MGFGLHNFPASLASEAQSFPVFAFADGVIFMAEDGGQLAVMTNELCQELAALGLQLQAEKRQAVFNRHCRDCSPPVVGAKRALLPVSGANLVLGCVAHPDCYEEPEEVEKDGRAWKAYWRLSHIFSSQHARPEDGLALLNSAVGPVVLWASESVCPTVAHLRHLIRLERSMTRLVYRVPRLPGEE
eukprot:15465138-Alexandrium_andersonii.AAC.1